MFLPYIFIYFRTKFKFPFANNSVSNRKWRLKNTVIERIYLADSCVVSRAIQIVRQGKAIRIWWAGEWFDNKQWKEGTGETHIARRLVDHSVTRFFTVRHWFQLVNWFGTMAREKKERKTELDGRGSETSM